MSKGLTIIVMGVCGCGKSTVAQYLAERLQAECKDGDELHPAKNIERMSAGLALTDEDRLPWLRAVAAFASEKTAHGGICVIACSALKKQYREVLNSAGKVLYVYLDGSRALIEARMSQRENHFMPESLIQSQFAALEVPDSAGEQVVAVDISASVDAVIASAEAQVRAHALYQACTFHR